MFSSVKHLLRYNPNKFGKKHIYAGIFMLIVYHYEIIAVA